MTTPKKSPKKRLGKGLSAMLDTTGHTKTKQRSQAAMQPNSPVAIEIEKQDSSESVLSDPKDGAPTPVELASATAEGGIASIPLDRIQPGSHQPRTHFDGASLDSLAASIRSVGVIQPITVRPDGQGGFELIAGERRWRASKIAGLDAIPAIVTHADEQEAAETALIENLQREDLNPIERGDAIRRLIDRFGFSQATVAERVGLDRSSVSNLLRLADLEEPIRDILASGLLGLGHGKALLSFPPGRTRIDTAARASREGWSVRRLEEESRRVRALENGASENQDAGGSPAGAGGGVETRALEKRLGEHLGTKINLRVDRSGKGTIQIRFFDLDHFDDLMARIGFDASGSADVSH